MEMITAITQVFTDIGEWFAVAMETMTSVFWNATEQQLTVLGVLAVAGLAVSVILLVLNMIRSYLRFS